MSSASGMDERGRIHGCSFSAASFCVRRSRSRLRAALRSSMPTGCCASCCRCLAAFGTACFGLSYPPDVLRGLCACRRRAVRRGRGLFLARRRATSCCSPAPRAAVCTVASIAGGLVVKLPLLLLVLERRIASSRQCRWPSPWPCPWRHGASCSKRHARRARARAGLAAGEGVSDAVAPSRAASASAGPSALVRCSACSAAPASRRVAARRLADRRAVLVLLAVAAVVLAVIRSVSYLGMWGDTNAETSPRPAAVALRHRWCRPACVAAFAYVARRAHGRRRAARSVSSRRSCSSSWACSSSPSRRVPAPSVAGVPHRGHSDRRAVRASACSGPSWQLCARGARPAVVPRHGVCRRASTPCASIAWVLLLSTAAIVDTLLVMLATYALVIGALYATWFAGRRQADEARPAEGEAAPLSETVADTCLEIARRYAALSARDRGVHAARARAHALVHPGRSWCCRTAP